MRYYSSTAGKMTLPAAINATVTTFALSSTSGLPGSTPFTLILDVAQPSEEIVTVTAVSGASVTVVRGEDGSTATAHPAGAVVRHGLSARDLRESREHEDGTSQVHGVTGSVVGTSDVQGLTNKNLTSATNTFPTSLATLTGVQTLSNKTLNSPLVVALTAASVAQTVRGAASQTASLTDWSSSSGTSLAKVDKSGSFRNNVGNVGTVLLSGSDTPTVYQAFIGGGDPAVDVLRVNAPTGQTADIASFAVNGAEMVKVTAAGGVVALGDVSAPSATVTGAVSGVTGAFTGNVIAANLSANMPSTSAAKAGKRLVPITTTVTPDGTGYATVTHNLGFTPAHVTGNAEFAYTVGIDLRTATTFRVRLLNPVTGAAATGATFLMLNCWE